MDMFENLRDIGGLLLRGDISGTPPPLHIDQRHIEDLVARGDFANFPPPPANARSLTCSRLVDENNLLKPLPIELIGEPVSAREELVSAYEVVDSERMDIQTSEATLLPSSTMESISFPAVQQSRPRKRREERKSKLISQGGRQVSGDGVCHEKCTISRVIMVPT